MEKSKIEKFVSGIVDATLPEEQQSLILNSDLDSMGGDNSRCQNYASDACAGKNDRCSNAGSCGERSENEGCFNGVIVFNPENTCGPMIKP